jgi:hypothetical protein
MLNNARYTCWAFPCATMLCASMKSFVKHCHRAGLIDQGKMDQCIQYISEENFHIELYNFIVQLMLPQKLQRFSQTTYLSAVVARIVHPTVIEPRGLDLFVPIRKLIKCNRYVGLATNQMRVYYKTYKNDYKRALYPGETSICQAINLQLQPVASVDLTHVVVAGSVITATNPGFPGHPHAMVLETINDNNELVFAENGNNTKYTLPANHPTAPDEFQFIHIEPIGNPSRQTSI